MNQPACNNPFAQDQGLPRQIAADAPARRKPGALERSHFALAVIGIVVGLFYISRALLAA